MMARPRKYRTDAERQKAYRQRKSKEKRNGKALRNAVLEHIKISSPPLRYFGGKWRIAPWIIEHFPEHITYVEPFSGGAGVLFRKQPSPYEIINDINRELVTFFDVLRSRTDELLEAIVLTPMSRYEHRRAHIAEESLDPLEIARRVYVRSRQSFGTGEGKYSTGWRYQGNSNRGTSIVDEWHKFDHLIAAACRLKNVQIECDDALAVIKRFDSKDTLFYVDPPYVWDTRYNQQDMYANELSDNDHVQLAEELKAVEGMVIVSGYMSDLYQELYGDWTVVQKKTRTNGGGDAMEYLWLSPQATSINRLPLFEAKS